jgi:glutathione-dependent peroxiredoxin
VSAPPQDTGGGPPPGTRAPDAELCRLGEDGRVERVRTGALFAGRTVVVFALPGAFTPTCSAAHVPRFNQLAGDLAARGIDDIFCISVNDPYVMAAWAESLNAGRVGFLADPEGAFSGALGLLADKRAAALGVRSRRYAMLVRDGVIERAFVERDGPGDPFAVSDADTLLAYLDPEAPALVSIALLARRGCPHCARARRLLEARGLPFETIELDDRVTVTSVRALTGRSTVPQVFIQGRLVGGADELERHLARERTAPARA